MAAQGSISRRRPLDAIGNAVKVMLPFSIRTFAEARNHRNASENEKRSALGRIILGRLAVMAPPRIDQNGALPR
jgi:hypothetical protein